MYIDIILCRWSLCILFVNSYISKVITVFWSGSSNIQLSKAKISLLKKHWKHFMLADSKSWYQKLIADIMCFLELD